MATGRVRANEADHAVRLVRIAGVLFLTGSLFSIPSGIVIEPAPPLSDYWILFTGR
jgi:hypothetical protein